MSQSTPTPAGRISQDPINMRAARIASLALAANLILSGSSLPTRLQIETVVLDLMDVAGILAAQLAFDTEDLDFPVTKGA